VWYEVQDQDYTISGSGSAPDSPLQAVSFRDIKWQPSTFHRPLQLTRAWYTRAVCLVLPTKSTRVGQWARDRLAEAFAVRRCEVWTDEYQLVNMATALSTRGSGHACSG